MSDRLKITWSQLKSKATLAPGTLKKRNSHLRTIQKYLNSLGLEIDDPMLYSDPGFIDVIVDLMDGYEPATQSSFLDVFSVLGEYYNGSTRLLKMIMELTREADKNTVSKVKPACIDKEFMEKTRMVMENSPNRAISIIASFIYYGAGGIRIGDLVNIKMDDDGKHSYIDLNTGLITIRGGSNTKNKQPRHFKIPNDLVTFIKREQRGDWLLTNNRLEKYADSKSLGKSFQHWFGVAPGEVRKGVVQETVDDGCNFATTVETANRLGHAPTTEIAQYTERPKETPSLPPIKPRKLKKLPSIKPRKLKKLKLKPKTD